MSNTGRLNGLDGLRAIAALSVFVHHFTEHASKLKPEVFYAAPVGGITDVFWPFKIGANGVTLFFIISGFVILASLTRLRSGADFAVGRFSRLYPLFWTAVLATTLVRILVGGDHISFSSFLANLTMAPGLFNAPMIDGVYWTLIVELKFYLLAYLIWRVGLIDRVEAVCAGWVILAVVLKLSSGRLISSSTFELLNSLLILSHAALFTCGVVLFRLHASGQKRHRWLLLAASLSVVFVAGGLVKGLVALLSTAAILRVCRHPTSILTTPPLVYLGSASYAIYLLHVGIGWHIARRLYLLGWGLLEATLVSAALCLVIALLFHHLIEKPSQSHIRRWWIDRRINASARSA